MNLGRSASLRVMNTQSSPNAPQEQVRFFTLSKNFQIILCSITIKGAANIRFTPCSKALDSRLGTTCVEVGAGTRGGARRPVVSTACVMIPTHLLFFLRSGPITPVLPKRRALFCINVRRRSYHHSNSSRQTATAAAIATSHLLERHHRGRYTTPARPKSPWSQRI